MMKLRLFSLCLVLLASTASAQTFLGTCPIFPPNNPWNQRVDTLPVHPRSQKFIDSVAGKGKGGIGGTIHLHPDFGSNALYGIPWIGVNGSQPNVAVNITGYVSESDPGPMPIPPNAKIEQPSDSHVLVVDTTNKKLYELYQGKKDQSGSGWSCTCSAIFDLGANKYRKDGWTSADAAGLPIFPGLVRKYECDAGEIKHAIRFTVPYTSKGWIFPARHHAGATIDTTNVMPMGLRLRLKASFDDSKFTGYAKVIATAMKRYGIIMADNGSSWFITGENNTNWPDDDISQLKSIVGNDFEVVYTGPIRTSPDQFPDPTFNSQSLSVSTSTLVFGDVTLGKIGYDTVTLTNSGSTAINIVSAQLALGDPAFAIIGHPTTIPANGFLKVALSFTPTKMGAANARLNITTDETGSPTYSVILNANGVAGILFASPSLIDFGSVDTGSMLTKNGWLHNNGNVSLTLTSYSIGGSGYFSVPVFFAPITIKAGDSTSIGITYAPHAVEHDSATFTASATDIPDVSIAVRGDGVAGAQGVNSQPSASGISLDILPNPAIGSATASFSLPTASRASLTLYDALGREVRQISTGSRSSGLNAESFSVTDLSSGTYYVRLMVNGVTTTKALEVQH